MNGGFRKQFVEQTSIGRRNDGRMASLPARKVTLLLGERSRRDPASLPKGCVPRARKHLSADALYALLRLRFEKIPDHRGRKCPISLTDALMSAFGMFSLKDPSFWHLRSAATTRTCGICSGSPAFPRTRTCERSSTPWIRGSCGPCSTMSFANSSVERPWSRSFSIKDVTCSPLDGTGYFSSSSIHCDSCLEKVHKQTGEVTYQHQMLAAVMMHPEHREVIPLAPEPIEKQDGSEKNDCERNAAKRLLRQIRQEHPHLKLIVVEDGLASNAPHIRELQNLNMHFILGAKPGDHPFLFDEVHRRAGTRTG